MTIYYRVNLRDGIKPDPKPWRYYSGSPDLGKTIFKSFRAAKCEFDQITRMEMARIKQMRRKFMSIKGRKQLLEIEP